MSTRSTTNFGVGPPPGKPTAKVYRHSDGYPEVMLLDFVEFFETVEKETADHRYCDASYLASKWVVFLARKFSALTAWDSDERVEGSLNFMSVGICMEDPSDIEFTYWVDCSRAGGGRRPAVYMCAVVSQSDDVQAWKLCELPS